MIRTRFTELFGVGHPVAQGGMQCLPVCRDQTFFDLKAVATCDRLPAFQPLFQAHLEHRAALVA